MLQKTFISFEKTTGKALSIAANVRSVVASKTPQAIATDAPDFPRRKSWLVGKCV